MRQPSTTEATGRLAVRLRLLASAAALAAGAAAVVIAILLVRSALS